MANSIDSSDILDCSNSTSSIEELDVIDEQEYGIYPYRFEPPALESIEERPAVEQDIQRLQNTEWCACFNCVAMPTVEESVCCLEMEKVKNKAEEEKDVLCIIGHIGFEPVCLNKHVLQTAYFGFRQEYGHYEEEEIHKRYRYTAYRQFVRWCYGFLGKKIRVPIPSCVVKRIQEEFPSIDYEGFHPHPELPALN